MYVLSHALGPTGWYSVLSFRISTVFDINPLELVCFRNSRYFVSSCSFSCPALPFSLSFSYFKCKSENNLGVFRPFPTVFILGWDRAAAAALIQTGARGSCLCARGGREEAAGLARGGREEDALLRPLLEKGGYGSRTLLL